MRSVRKTQPSYEAEITKRENRTTVDGRAHPSVLLVNPKMVNPKIGCGADPLPPGNFGGRGCRSRVESSLLVVHRSSVELLACRIGAFHGYRAGFAVSRDDDATRTSNFAILLEGQLQRMVVDFLYRPHV